MGVIVETTGGKLEGLQGDGFQAFRGIPFARPPVGPLRFRPPEPAEPWSGVRDATQYGHSAPQAKASIEFLGGWSVGEQSEDCLYLNVVTPAADGARRPVMVWIHGGAYTVGSGSQPMYDPLPLVARGDVTSSPSTTASAPSASSTQQSSAATTSARAATPPSSTRRRPSPGCATTPPLSAAIPRTSPSSASPRAA